MVKMFNKIKKLVRLLFAYINTYCFERYQTGDKLIISSNNRVTGNRSVWLIGEGTRIQESLISNIGIHISCSSADLIIDRSVFIASGAKIYTGNHDLDDLDRHTDAQDIKIENDCWLGANSVVLCGVMLGPKTIVAAGSVVTKSWPSGHVVIGGVPAREIRKL